MPQQIWGSDFFFWFHIIGPTKSCAIRFMLPPPELLEHGGLFQEKQMDAGQLRFVIVFAEHRPTVLDLFVWVHCWLL